MSAKVRRNEQCWQTLDTDDTFEPTIGFKKFTVNSNSKNKVTNNKSTVLLISIFIHMKICITIYNPTFGAHALLSDRLWAPRP